MQQRKKGGRKGKREIWEEERTKNRGGKNVIWLEIQLYIGNSLKIKFITVLKIAKYYNVMKMLAYPFCWYGIRSMIVLVMGCGAIPVDQIHIP